MRGPATQTPLRTPRTPTRASSTPPMKRRRALEHIRLAMAAGGREEQQWVGAVPPTMTTTTTITTTTPVTTRLSMNHTQRGLASTQPPLTTKTGIQVRPGEGEGSLPLLSCFFLGGGKSLDLPVSAPVVGFTIRNTPSRPSVGYRAWKLSGKLPTSTNVAWISIP